MITRPSSMRCSWSIGLIYYVNFTMKILSMIMLILLIMTIYIGFCSEDKDLTLYQLNTILITGRTGTWSVLEDFGSTGSASPTCRSGHTVFFLLYCLKDFLKFYWICVSPTCKWTNNKF